MTKRMLIDASHPEETRVVIVDGTKVEELDFESAAKKQLRGNLYLARVTRVEPSLQAAFVEYGGNRHGFLAFSEIHPDYYQIPYEDRMALIEAEEAETLEEEAEEEAPSKNTKKNSKKTKSEDDTKPEDSDDVSDDEGEDEAESVEEITDGEDEDVADEQKKTAERRKSRSYRQRYKIQEVIKRGQILLIQVVKEERGNKGAAMTTYLSLAGRYCVLMPNTPKGGGISRKISNGTDRKLLKSIVSEFEVPQGMGVIVRTAGAKKTKSEIKRDYDYLCRLWETIRSTTLKSIAPALIHEEGDLVKRSIRDLYNKDIKEVLVQGDDAYKSAKNFIKMLMPSHAKNVKAYKEDIPLFLRYQVESQIEDSLESVVQLKSGGYLVIHPTEALVSIDVNSGRSTKERNVERTALKTNLEAADEVARQMRLRDLAGLIVIDFIDMDENRNNRSVEKRMKDALSRDRARVQAGRISQFGLMEISRQRRRRSLLDGSTTSCPHCQGVGRKRTVESSALKALRALEEKAARGQTAKSRLIVASEVAGFILNHKREELNSLQEAFGMFAVVEADPELFMPEYSVTVEKKKSGKNEDPLASIEKELKKAKEDADKAERKKPKKSTKESSKESAESDDEDKDDEKSGKKRRRRGRRGGRRRRNNENSETEKRTEESQKAEMSDDKSAKTEDGADKEVNKDEKKTSSRNSRSRQSSKSKAEASKEPNLSDKEEAKTENTGSKTNVKDSKSPKKKPSTRSKTSRSKKTAEKPTEAVDTAKPAKAEEKPKTESVAKPTRKSTTRRKAPTRTKPAESSEKTTSKTEGKAETKPTATKKAARKTTSRSTKKADPVPAKTKTAAKATSDDADSKKKGWWQRRSKVD
ncbi:MAG: Rne/Rng family ribonuclease [Hellea sp.]|nr:Rne/Rng family ribonuclease [Hellea sp.]